MTIKEIIKEQDEKFEGMPFVNYGGCDGCEINFKGIQEIRDYLLSRDQAILEGVVEMIKKLETQKFLDTKCQVGDFVKLDDVLAIIKN